VYRIRAAGSAVRVSFRVSYCLVSNGRPASYQVVWRVTSHQSIIFDLLFLARCIASHSKKAIADRSEITVSNWQICAASPSARLSVPCESR